MRASGALAAEGVPSALGTQQMLAHNATLDHAITPPGGPSDNSAALLSHWQHSLFQQDAITEPGWQPQHFWWHAGLALE